jgi:DNA polymerase III delta subunit
LVKNEPRIYLLVGDAFLIEEARKSICKRIRTVFKTEIPERSYRIKEAPLEKILADARTLPFLTEAQILRIGEAESFKKSDVELLDNYLRSPSDSSYLFFESSMLTKGDPLAKLIAERGEVQFLEDRGKLSASVRLIEEKLRRNGKKMAPGAIERLKEQAGEAPGLLDSILEQLMTYAGDEKTITEDMVERFEEDWRTADPFQLTDALIAGKTDRALMIWKRLMEDQEKEVTAIVGVLHWQLRRSWRGRSLMEQGRSQEQILKECRVSPKQAPYFMRQLRAMSLDRLERAIDSLFQLDWASKTGRNDTFAAFESWLVRTASNG